MKFGFFRFATGSSTLIGVVDLSWTAGLVDCLGVGTSSGVLSLYNLTSTLGDMASNRGDVATPIRDLGG